MINCSWFSLPIIFYFVLMFPLSCSYSSSALTVIFSMHYTFFFIYSRFFCILPFVYWNSLCIFTSLLGLIRNHNTESLEHRFKRFFLLWSGLFGQWVLLFFLNLSNFSLLVHFLVTRTSTYWLKKILMKSRRELPFVIRCLISLKFSFLSE